MNGKYDEIMGLPHHVSKTRPQMPMSDRAALNVKYQFLMDALDEEPEIKITYFKPDERKAGGEYVSAIGTVKKVDDFERLITMQDGTRIPMDDVYDMSISVITNENEGD